jgi:hypothetical protein
MIILTSFKPFSKCGEAQRAAVASWRKYAPATIFAFGDHEDGVKEACKELGIVNIPTSKILMESGLPLLDAVVEFSEDHAYDDEVITICSPYITFTQSVKPIENHFYEHEDPLVQAHGIDVFMWKKGFFKRAKIAPPSVALYDSVYGNWISDILRYGRPAMDVTDGLTKPQD